MSSPRPAGPRSLAFAAVVLFALQTWLIASWVEWQFGAELRASRLHRRLRPRRAVRRARPLLMGGAPPENGAACRGRRDGRRPAVGRADVSNTGSACCLWPTRRGRNTGSVSAIPMTRASWINAAARSADCGRRSGVSVRPAPGWAPSRRGCGRGSRIHRERSSAGPPAARRSSCRPTSRPMTVPLRAVFPGPNGAPVMVELRDDGPAAADHRARATRTRGCGRQLPLKRYHRTPAVPAHRPARLARPSSIRARRDDWRSHPEVSDLSA